jgi:hypothetical protein
VDQSNLASVTSYKVKWVQIKTIVCRKTCILQIWSYNSIIILSNSNSSISINISHTKIRMLWQLTSIIRCNIFSSNNRTSFKTNNRTSFKTNFYNNHIEIAVEMLSMIKLLDGRRELTVQNMMMNTNKKKWKRCNSIRSLTWANRIASTNRFSWESTMKDRKVFLKIEIRRLSILCNSLIVFSIILWHLNLFLTKEIRFWIKLRPLWKP